MKNIIYILVFLLSGQLLTAQQPMSGSSPCDTIPIQVFVKKIPPTYQLLGKDTINRVDKDSLKQGIWFEYDDSGFGKDYFGDAITSYYKNGLVVRRNHFNSQVSYTENFNSEGLKHGYDSRIEDIFGYRMYENGKPKKARPCMHFSQTREFEYYLNGAPKNRAHSWVSGCIDTIENVLNFTFFKYSDSIGCYNRPNIIESMYYYQGKLEGKYFYVDEETGEDTKIEHYSNGELLSTKLFLKVPRLDTVFRGVYFELDSLKQNIQKRKKEYTKEEFFNIISEFVEQTEDKLYEICKHQYSEMLIISNTQKHRDVSYLFEELLKEHDALVVMSITITSIENDYKHLEKTLKEFYTIKDKDVTN